MLTYVWAEDEKHAIGYQGHLPWHLPADLQHFKEKTMSHAILMGRKTFASLPQILPGRQHLVLTHQQALKEKYQNNPQVTVFLSVKQMQDYINRHQDLNIDVIGGSSLFELLKDRVEVLEKTQIHAIFAADAFMPLLNYDDFDLVKKASFVKDDHNHYAYDFLTYRRKRN